MARSPSGGFALLLACALAGLGCTQSVGGRCVQDSDCESGLCSVTGVTVSAGHCESNIPTTLPDGSSSGGAGGAAGAGGTSGSAGAGGASGAGAAGAGGLGGAGGSGGRGSGGSGGSHASDAAVDSHPEGDGHAADARSDLGADH